MERMSSKVKGPVDVSERIKDTKQEIAHLSAELQKLITSNVKKSDKLEDDFHMQARHSLTHIDISKINVASSDKQVDKPLHFLPESNLPKNSHTGCCSNIMCREKTEEVESPPKIRTYSRDEAREFIKKQREKRTKQLKLQSSENKNNIDLKKQKLKELRQKSLEIVARNVQSKRARSKSRERSEVRLDRSNAPTVRLRGSSVDRMSVGTNNKISTSCGDLINSQSNINLANRTYRAMTKLEDKEKLTRPSRMKSNSQILNKNLSKPPMHPIEHFNISVNRQASDLNIKDAPIVKRPIRLKNITLRTENFEEYSNQTTVQGQKDAAIKIQALYRGYRERKQLKENMSKMTKPTENKSSHSRETKETQTNLEQQMPIWLQPSNVVPYPCNFINTVKRKLQHVVNSPKICRDIGIQSSIIDQLQEGHQANKNDNNEFLAKGTKSNRSDPRSLLSHKCLNLDPGGVEHLELISNRINKVTVIKRGRKRNDSESDTSKNIPDISSESGTSLKNNAANVKSCSSNGEEIKNGKGVVNLQINSDKLRRLKLKSPSLLSIKTVISDSNDVVSDVKSEASNNKKSDSRLKTSSEISDNLKSPEKSKTNKNSASKYSYTFDFCGNEPETYESPASLNAMDLYNNQDTVPAIKGLIHSPRDSIISYNCSEYSQKSLKTPENNLVSMRSNKTKSSKKSASSGKKSVITSETCTKSTEKLSHSPRESIISSNCSNYNNQSCEKNSPKNFEATPTFPHSNKLRPQHGVTVRETFVEKCTGDLNIIQNIENSIDTSLVSHISDNGSISSQTTGKSKNSKFHLSPLSAILPEQIKHSSALKIYSNTGLLTNNSKSNDLVNTTNSLNKHNVIEKLNSGSEEKPVPSEESQTVIDTQISDTLNTVHSALNSSSSKHSLEHLDSSKFPRSASETSQRPVSFKSLYSSDPSSLKMDNISTENRSRVTEPMEVLVQPTVSLCTNNNVKCQENNRKLVSRALPTTKNSINVKDNSKEIHLKFEAEVHLLNDFNESMKQFMAVEKTFETIKNKNARNVQPVKILQNQDTQTSMVQRSLNEKISKPTEHTTSIISTINYSRGSEFDTTGISIDNIDSTMLSTGLEISNINNTTNEQIELTKFDPENYSSKNFAGLSLKMFDQLLTDEDVRIENLKTIIKIREQALLDRTKGELAWLEIQRKHFKETGKIHEASLVKKKQRGILIKHQQERHEMQRLKQMQKVASHERKIVLKEQRNLIKAQLSTNKMLSKMKMNTPRKQKQLGPLKVLQTSESILSETSISRKDSAGEEIFTVTSHSIINRMSEVESDSAPVDNKKMFKVPAQDRQISEIQRVLLVRQAALQKRRKDVEDLLKWNQKLLDEEKKIAELEMTANAIISQMPSVNKQDNSETSPKKHKFQGFQLNQLWKKMTGLDERKFEPSKIYTLSQTSLERFCRDARNYAIKNKNSTPRLENLSSINSDGSKDLSSDASISDIPSRRSFSASQVSENLRIPSEKSSAIDLHYSSDFEDSSLSAKRDVENKKITSISELIEDFTKIKNEISSLGLKTDENYISEDIQKSSSTSATSDSQKKSSVIETNKISSRIMNGTSSLGNQNLNTNGHTDAISEAIGDLIVNEESAVSEQVKSSETTTMEEAIEEIEEAACMNQNHMSSELVSLDTATLDEVSMKHVQNNVASEINLEPIEDQIEEESDASASKTSEGVEEIPSVENVEEPFITENKDYTSVDNTSLSEDIEHVIITHEEHIPKTSEIEGITNSGVHQITTETGNNIADESISEKIPADEPNVSTSPDFGFNEQSPSNSLQIDHVLSCGIIVRKRFAKKKSEAKGPEVHKNDTTPKKISEALDDEKTKTETASVEIKTTTDSSEVSGRNSATSNFDLVDMFGNEKDRSSDNTPNLTIPEERPLSAVETSEMIEIDGSQPVIIDREKSNNSESGESASEPIITSSLTPEDIDEESFYLPSSKLLVKSSTSNLGMMDLFGDMKDISGTNEKIQIDLSFKSGKTISEAEESCDIVENLSATGPSQKPTFEQEEEVADTVQITSPTESKTEDDFEKSSVSSRMEIYNGHLEKVHLSSDAKFGSNEEVLETGDTITKSKVSEHSLTSSETEVQIEKVSSPPDVSSSYDGKIPGNKESKSSSTCSKKKIDELPEKESSSSASKSGSSENMATKSNESGTSGSSSKDKIRDERSKKGSLSPNGRSGASEIFSATKECKRSRSSSKRKIDDHPEKESSSAIKSGSSENIAIKSNESGTSGSSSKKKILDEPSGKIALSPDVTSNGEKMSGTKESKSSFITSKKDIQELPENKMSSAVESSSSEMIMKIEDIATKSNQFETSLTSSNKRIQDKLPNSSETISETKESKTSRTSSKKKLNEDLEEIPSSAGKSSSSENVLPIEDSATKSNESIISLAPSKKEVHDGASEKVAISSDAIFKSREDILEIEESSMRDEGTSDLVELPSNRPSTEFTLRDVEDLLEMSELQKSRIYNEVVHVPSKRSTSKKIAPKAEDVLRLQKDGSKNNDSESTSADVSSIHSLPSESEKDLFESKSCRNDVDKSIGNNNLLKNAIKSLEDDTASGREKIIEDKPNHGDAILSPKTSSFASEIRSEKIELSRTDDRSLQENVENKPTDIHSALSEKIKPVAVDAGSISIETSKMSPVLSKTDEESAIAQNRNESSLTAGDLLSKESSTEGGSNFHRRSEKVTGESKTDDKRAEIDDSTSRKLASVNQSLKSDLGNIDGSSTITSQEADEDLEDGGSNATSEKPISLKNFDGNVTDDKESIPDIGDVNCKRDDNKMSTQESAANLLSKESNTGLENDVRSKLTVSKSEDSSNMYLEDFEEDKSNLTTEDYTDLIAPSIVSIKQMFDSQNESISTASQSDNGTCLNDTDEISVIAIEKNFENQLKDDKEQSEKFVISSSEDPKDEAAFPEKEEIGMLESEKSADMEASGDVSVATDENAQDLENSVSASGDAQLVTITNKAEFRKKKAIDIRKRVSEILANTVDTSKNDKSPRSQDYYVTTYEDPTPTNSSDSESPVHNTQLYAVNNIFGNEAQELLKKQLAIEQEIKQLVQQQKEQIPFVFMREIPNKPPPPYTPPSSNQNSITPSLIPYEVEDLDNMTNYASKVLYNAYLSNNLEGVKFSEPDFKIISKTSSSKECCLFVFDLCKEVSKIHYKQFEKEKGPSWLRIQKRSKMASKKPFGYQELQKYITSKVRELLGFEKPCIKENAIMKWSRKRKDHVDEILVLESQAEEAEWINYDRDELLVKDEVTNEILNILLAETATVFNDILARKTFLS